MLSRCLFLAALVAVFTSNFASTSAARAAEEAATAADHSADDHGAGDHTTTPPILSFDPGSAAVNLAIFLLTFGVLAKFVWPVILNGLKAREDKIRSDLEDAKAANEKAEARLAEYEQKVSDAASEAQAVLAEARRDAEASATKIVDEAKADAKRQADRALADIETAKKVALSEIAEQTSSLAIGVAKQVVGRELNADDHSELIRKALDQVPSNN
ncbi:MAG: F0F1 ATP synthase subunit B [Planctomycetota bacterium]